MVMERGLGCPHYIIEVAATPSLWYQLGRLIQQQSRSTDRRWVLLRQLSLIDRHF